MLIISIFSNFYDFLWKSVQQLRKLLLGEASEQSATSSDESSQSDDDFFVENSVEDSNTHKKKSILEEEFEDTENDRVMTFIPESNKADNTLKEVNMTILNLQCIGSNEQQWHLFHYRQFLTVCFCFLLFL